MLTEEVDSFSSGVPVGYDQPLPRVSAVFPPKERFRKLDDSIFMEDSANYKSADGMSHKLEEKFREEEALGRMYPTTLGVAITICWTEGADSSDGSLGEAGWRCETFT